MPFSLDRFQCLLTGKDNRHPRRALRRRRMAQTGNAESLEERLLLTLGEPSLEFLSHSTTLYSHSQNAVDYGTPIFPLYTEFLAGGTYGTITDVNRLDLDANDPNSDRGHTATRMTWDGTGPNGYFQFDVSINQANRPRSLPGVELDRVRLRARGDQDGQRITARVFRTNGAGFQEVSGAILSLSEEWEDYAVGIPNGLAPDDLHAVQFLLGDGQDPGNGTVWLDEVRVTADGFDPLQVPQSYRRGQWVEDDPPPHDGSICVRDLYVYPNRAFLYDNALTILAFAESREPEALQLAQHIADAQLHTVLPDGSLFNVRNGGHVLDGQGAARDPWSQTRTLGDNAWFGLALLSLYRNLGRTDPTYLNAARTISDWAETNLRDNGSLGGYRGGFDASGQAFPWRSTEHNIDLFSLNRLLAFELNDPTYATRAAWAGDFVLEMFNDSASPGWFWTGTGAGDDINMSSIPLDAQVWAILALGESPEYADAIDWTEPLTWTEQNLAATDGPYEGFTFSSESTANRVWMEGTAQTALVYQQLGMTAEYSSAMDTLELARRTHGQGDGKGLVAASSDGLEDPFFGAAYDARLHTGATAWTWLASNGTNPFVPPMPLPERTGQSFVIEDWDFDVIDTHFGNNYFGGNNGDLGDSMPTLNSDSTSQNGYSLEISEQDGASFGGFFASVFGRPNVLVTTDSQVAPTALGVPDSTLDLLNIYNGFGPLEARSVDQLQFAIKHSLNESLSVRVELKDQNDTKVFEHALIIPATGGLWETQTVPLPTAASQTQVQSVQLVVEDSAHAAPWSFLLDDLRFVDTDGAYPDVNSPAITNSAGDLLAPYEGAFLEWVRSTSAQYFVDFASHFEAAGGIAQDRSTFADLMTVAGVGFQLTSYVISAEREDMPRAEAADRTLDILKVLGNADSQHPQGPGRTGTTGHEGFYYHFLGHDGLRKQNSDTPGTAKDESLDTVELSTIDTALAIAGAVTAAQYFDGNGATETQIRQLADDIYRDVNWAFMLDDARFTNTNQFFLGWKPNETRNDTNFTLDDNADPNSVTGQYSSRSDGSPATIDFYTDEGLLIALLAMGSPDPNHRLHSGVWDAMLRETSGGDFIRTFPGSLFTYQFASAWLDTEALGEDAHPQMPVDFFANTRAAIEAARDYAINNPANPDPDQRRDTYAGGAGATRWGLTAAEGPFGTYFAEAAPTAALDGHTPLEVGTVAPYGVGSSIQHAPELAIQSLFATAQEDLNDDQMPELLHPRFGFVDAFNLNVADATARKGNDFDPSRLVRPVEAGPWAHFNGFAIDHGPMLITIDNYLNDNFVPGLFMSHSGISNALDLLFPSRQPAFSVHQTDGETTVAENGARDTIRVALEIAPDSPVVIAATSGTTDEVTVSPTELTFTPTNWEVPQTVTVSGVDDSAGDGNTTTSVTFSIVPSASDDAFDNLPAQAVTVTNLNDDTVDAEDDNHLIPPDVTTSIDVLSNDFPTGATILSVTDPFVATTEIDGDRIRVTPDPGFSGVTTFDYTIAGAQDKVIPANGNPQDEFGHALAIDGNLAVVGVPNDDTAAPDAGIVHVFERQADGTWIPLAKLVAPDAEATDRFGFSVDVSGNTVVVGARMDDERGLNSGSVYVFTRCNENSDRFDFITRLEDPEGNAKDQFGHAVAIDGTTIVVGARLDDGGGTNSGSAFVFDLNGTWTLTRQIKPQQLSGGDQFGYSVAVDGNTVLVGARKSDEQATDAGSAWVFTRHSGGANNFGTVARLFAEVGRRNDWFGHSVALENQTALVGKPIRNQRARTGTADFFSEDEGGPGAWGRVSTLAAADAANANQFGYSVAINGQHAFIGSRRDDAEATNGGAVYAIERDSDDGTWAISHTINASDLANGDFFGSAVASSGHTLLAASPRDDDQGGRSGSIYINDLTTDTATVTITVASPLRGRSAASDNAALVTHPAQRAAVDALFATRRLALWPL